MDHKMKYTAMVFFGDEWCSEDGNSAEECLAKLEAKYCGYSHQTKFTFRPADGTIYANSDHVPCGVIFQVGYMDSRFLKKD